MVARSRRLRLAVASAVALVGVTLLLAESPRSQERPAVAHAIVFPLPIDLLKPLADAATAIGSGALPRGDPGS
jgi:hypothetical protein